MFCQKCFTSIAGDFVTVNEDSGQGSSTILKTEFKEKRNDHLEQEPFVDCKTCGRKLHQICVLHLDGIWPQGFVCDSCLQRQGLKRKENKFNVKRLPVTKLSTYVENRVNNFLKKKEAGAGQVYIRVVSSSEKAVEVKQEMNKRFVKSGELPERFPYRAKALFAFEVLDEVDVCFFGMHVQEYSSECPAPNTRRVYIAYLDSVHYFRPKQMRTAVYHEILLGYLDYVKQLGYTMAHIWACPPSEGDDYIFYSHPIEQKIPKPKKLQEWYRQMLGKGFAERIITDYKDILKQAVEDNVSSAAEMPYFEGDFWPNVLEESIKELNREEEEEKEKKRKQDEADAFAVFAFEEPSTSKKECKKSKIQSKSKSKVRKNRKYSFCYGGRDLTAKLYGFMEKHKDVFFTIKLHTAQSAVHLGPIHDPDPLITCDLMDGRDAFLTMARERHYEFSTLRRAKFSTMALVYELHDMNQDKFIYTCNSCSKNVETRYHCCTCDDFDLCEQCYRNEGHQHTMEKLGLDLDDGSSSSGQKVNSVEERGRILKQWLQLLVHGSQCRNANCHLPGCQRMQRLLRHMGECPLKKTISKCSKCSNLLYICVMHARQCKDRKCVVPACQNLRIRMQRKLHWQRLQQEQMVLRRIAATSGTALPQQTLPPVSQSSLLQTSSLAATPSAAVIKQDVVASHQVPPVKSPELHLHKNKERTSGVQLQKHKPSTCVLEPVQLQKHKPSTSVLEPVQLQKHKPSTCVLQPVQLPKHKPSTSVLEPVQLQKHKPSTCVLQPYTQVGTSKSVLQTHRARTSAVHLQNQSGTSAVHLQTSQAETSRLQLLASQAEASRLKLQASQAGTSRGEQTAPGQPVDSSTASRVNPRESSTRSTSSRIRQVARAVLSKIMSKSREETVKMRQYLHNHPEVKNEVVKLLKEFSHEQMSQTRLSSRPPLQNCVQTTREHSLQQGSSQHSVRFAAGEHPTTWVQNIPTDLQITNEHFVMPSRQLVNEQTATNVRRVVDTPIVSELRQVLLQFVALLQPPIPTDNMYQLAILLRRHEKVRTDFFRSWEMQRSEHLNQGSVKMTDIQQVLEAYKLESRLRNERRQQQSEQCVMVRYLINSEPESSQHLVLSPGVVVVNPSTGASQTRPSVTSANDF